jgi:hypothetical protein
MSNLYGLGLLGAAASDLFGDEARKLAVWVKGFAIPGYDAAIWRHDAFGHAMRYADYGDRNSEYGWEIDHIVATALGGSDDITNLRPLHHRINASLGGALSALFKG